MATRLQEGGEGAVDRVGEVGHEVAVEAHVSEKVERDEQVVDRLKAACLRRGIVQCHACSRSCGSGCGDERKPAARSD
eukprot:scaffold39031_cov32-Phaeocystis_antarctica.AAC.2